MYQSCSIFYEETNDGSQDKKVVIVHGRDLLLNEQFPDKFRKSVNRKLEARGVELVLGDYVAQFPENGGGEITFRSGRSLQADLVVIGPPFELPLAPWFANRMPHDRFPHTDPNRTLLGYPTLWAQTRFRTKDS